MIDRDDPRVRTARHGTSRSALPTARGPASAALIDFLRRPGVAAPPGSQVVVGTDFDDLHLTLYLCYELLYAGFRGVDDEMEWAAPVLTLRGRAEQRFLDELRARIPTSPAGRPSALPRRLNRLLRDDPDTGLSAFLRDRADLTQFREFVVHRSAYQLKEADPHTWAIPRLSGRPKAALVEIQADEYGGGRPGRLHSELFATTMRELELCDRPGALLDVVPSVSLATVNVASLFGLHRRWRGALVGHLAVLEMDSAMPNRAYGAGARRLGLTPDAVAFFDEHVEADAVHEQIATHDLCATFATDEPDRGGDVLFGAACCLLTYGDQARHLMESWAGTRSSLHPAADTAVPA